MNEIPQIALLSSPLPSCVRGWGVSHHNYDTLTLNLGNPYDNTTNMEGWKRGNPLDTSTGGGLGVARARTAPPHPDLDPQWGRRTLRIWLMLTDFVSLIKIKGMKIYNVR